MLKFNWTDVIQKNWFKLDLTHSNDLTKHDPKFSKLRLFKVNNFQCWQLFALFNTSRSTSSRGSSSPKNIWWIRLQHHHSDQSKIYLYTQEKKRNPPQFLQNSQSFITQGKLHHILSIKGFIAPLDFGSVGVLERLSPNQTWSQPLVDVWNPPKNAWYNVSYVLVWYGKISFWYSICWQLSVFYYQLLVKTPHCWSYNVGCCLSQTCIGKQPTKSAWVWWKLDKMTPQLMNCLLGTSMTHMSTLSTRLPNEVGQCRSPDLSSSGLLSLREIALKLWPAM